METSAKTAANVEEVC